MFCHSRHFLNQRCVARFDVSSLATRRRKCCLACYERRKVPCAAIKRTGTAHYVTTEMKFYIIKYAVLIVSIVCLFSVTRTVGAEPDPLFNMECPKDSTFALQSTIARRFKKLKTIVRNYPAPGGGALSNAASEAPPACTPLAHAGFCVSYPTEMQAYCCETALECEPDFSSPLSTGSLGRLQPASGSLSSTAPLSPPISDTRPKKIRKRHDVSVSEPGAENGGTTEPSRATEVAPDDAFVKMSSSLGSTSVNTEPTHDVCSCSHDGFLQQEREHVCNAISDSLQLVEKAQDMLASLWDRRRRRRLVNTRLFHDLHARRTLLPNRTRDAGSRRVDLSQEGPPAVDLGYDDPSVQPYTESGVDFHEAARLSRDSITSSTLGEMADLMSQFFDLVIHDYVGLAEEAVGLMLEILPDAIDVPNISAVELEMVSILRHVANRMEKCQKKCLAPLLAAVLEGGLVAGQSPRTYVNVTPTAVQRAVSRVLKAANGEGPAVQEFVGLEDAMILIVRLLRQFADSFELVLDNAPLPPRSPFRPSNAQQYDSDEHHEAEGRDAHGTENRGKNLSSINALIIHGIHAMGGVWHGLTSPDFMQDMLRVVFLVDRNLNRLSTDAEFQDRVKTCWEEGLCCQEKPVPAFLRSTSPKARKKKREIRALVKRALADTSQNATDDFPPPEMGDTKRMNFLPDVGRAGTVCTADDPSAFLQSLEHRFSDMTCDKIVALSSCFPTATIVEVEDLLLACIETWVLRCDNETNRQHLLKVKGREAVVLVDNFVRTREVCGQSVAAGAAAAGILVAASADVTEKRGMESAESVALSLFLNAFYPIIVVLVLGFRHTRMQFADSDFQ